MKLGVSTFAGPLSDLCEIADSVELYIPKMNLYEGRVLQKDRVNTFLDQFFSYDLPATAHAPYYLKSLEYPVDLSVDMSQMSKKDFQLMNESIDIAALAGADILVVHPGVITDSSKKSFGRMIHNLKILAQSAEDAGVMLALENKENTDPINLCCNAQELLSAVRAVDSEYLGAALDIGHANLTCGGDQTKLADYVKLLSPDVVHVHVHDNYGKDTGSYGGDEHMCPGRGVIDFSVLKNLGDYDGVFNMEVFSVEEAAEGKEFLSKVLL
ncbi:endonuclease 4 [Methanosarcinaceae archaeon Ag5]|uniref:Endonuclease 4 n=1 Tax=Methanolapillus africanus TaxID=3028297 RepID=A0AAE4MHP8_9EURY|nr:endonuclease 4 [Methanosarcinaceae archaeon Ag5]